MLDPVLVYKEVQSQLYTAAGALFFNGICLLLFALAVYFLVQIKTASSHLFLGVSAVLVAFALTHFIIDIVLASRMSELFDAVLADPAADVSAIETRWARLFSARQALTVTNKGRPNSAFADGVFLYRCYVIWTTSRFRITVVAVPALLVLITMVMGYVAVAVVPVPMILPYALALITNLVLLGLTAGRIWRKGRDATLLLGQRAGARYTTTMAIICESSLLYVLTLLIYFIPASTMPVDAALPNFVWGAMPQVLNIIPLVILVRVGLARVFVERQQAGGGLAAPLISKSGASEY
ncbi:hypothetical protein FB451DRAFT_1550905 [Mycena latifolia]|nr:hypothetical protein FB451DRAFT_1550905 [Mycena latifolia]